MKKEELDNSWEEVIFNGFMVLLFIFIFGYLFFGLFKGLEISLENSKQTGILRSAYENNEGTDYVLDKTIYLKSINMDIVNTTQNKKTGNSKIGKFFVQNIEEETSESKTKEEFYLLYPIQSWRLYLLSEEKLKTLRRSALAEHVRTQSKLES